MICVLIFMAGAYLLSRVLIYLLDYINYKQQIEAQRKGYPQALYRVIEKPKFKLF